MYSNMDSADVVKRGKCMYSIDTEYEVAIVKWHVLYGTGDYEDSNEISTDQNIECYYVLYENFMDKGSFNAGGGAFLSLEEAVKSVESMLCVEWI